MLLLNVVIMNHSFQSDLFSESLDPVHKTNLDDLVLESGIIYGIIYYHNAFFEV